MLAPYAAVLRTSGGLAFSSAGFFARLPISMTGLGMVLLVSARTGSYGLAGAVSATYLLVSSATAPLQARLADSFGQGRVLWPLLGGQLVGFALFLAGATASPRQLFVAAALIGATQGQIGSMVRARWTALVGGTPLLHTAYALESVLDEAIFVIGPVAVTLLAVQVDPSAGLVATLVLAVGGGAAFAVQRRTEPAVHDRGVGPRPPIPVGELMALGLGFLALGAVFGSLDVAVVASADAAGRRGVAGAVLACFAGGSMLAGLAFGAVRWSGPMRTRLLTAHAVLAVAVLPLPFLPGLGTLAAVALVVGAAISPTLVTGFSLVEQVVPAARLTEGLAWVSTAIGAGVAAGATLAGQVVDVAGPRASLWMPVAAAAVAVVPALAAQVRRSGIAGRAAWRLGRR